MSLRELRGARRRRYVERLDLMELLYRAYLALIFGGIALAFLGGAIDEATASPAAVDAIRDQGPAVLGLLAAAALLAGLRTGARGGPLAIEPAEVQYVLLAPLDRGSALRPAAVRQLRIGAAAGLLAGAVVASFALRRLPGSPVEWIACLAAFGALVPVSFLGAALLASGRRLRPLPATAAGLVLLAWSGADLVAGTTTSPGTFLGLLATLPLQAAADGLLAALGAGLAIALLAAGLAGIGGMLLEAARRRARLAAELRFSASVQDLRTVVLLRRQLAAERPRRRPWLRLAASGGDPVRRRAWQSLLRWPPARISRVLLLALAAGVAAVGAFEVSVVLAVLPGALLFVAALDLIEPLAQESDHPTRSELLPLRSRELFQRHLVAPAAGLGLLVLVAALAAAALAANAAALAAGAVIAVPTGFALAVCAAISATNDPYQFVLTPQLSYVQSLGPAVAAVLLCGLPVLGAYGASRQGSSLVGPMVPLAILSLLLAYAGTRLLGMRMADRRAVAA